MKTIQQTVRFGVSPERLFEIYMDSKKHGAAIKSRVSVSRKVGSRFSAFGGMLRGRILALAPKRMIVQTWRGADWPKREGDSILVLTFTKAGRGGQINLVHTWMNPLTTRLILTPEFGQSQKLINVWRLWEPLPLIAFELLLQGIMAAVEGLAIARVLR